MAEAFTFFWKHRLSQWHRSPFTIGSVTFTHAEQYMMYAKALLFGDRDAAERILAAKTPREQQAIGRTVRVVTPDSASALMRASSHTDFASWMSRHRNGRNQPQQRHDGRAHNEQLLQTCSPAAQLPSGHVATWPSRSGS